jgi:4-hydroxy-tetrahydrodipicolinate reductase
VIKVGVVGAAGRMGRTVIGAVEDAPDLHLVALIDPNAGDITFDREILRVSKVEDLDSALADVLIDFTTPDVARTQVPAALERGFHLVVGTTGLGDEVMGQLDDISSSSGMNAIVAPNFAIGAVLLMRFAREAARYFDAAEIIEFHHDKKLDAPSGTAIETAHHISQGRDESGRHGAPEPTTKTVLEGARGGRGEDDVPIHSVRLPGLVAHEEVIFGSPGQTLTIRHDSIDRSSFMAGVLIAVREVATRPGITLGLESLLPD